MHHSQTISLNLKLLTLLAVSAIPWSAGLADRPARINIVPDDNHTRLVGSLPDGRLFFVTYPFIPDVDGVYGREFFAAYFWNPDGTFREAIIQPANGRNYAKKGVLESFFSTLIGDMSEAHVESISVEPFTVERGGITFGLEYVDHEGAEWVISIPGDYLAFTPPWNGEYDT